MTVAAQVPPGERLSASRPSLLLLCAASSLSPFGMSVIFPALAGIADFLGIGAGQAQYLIAAYLFGLGLGQPVAGVLADRLGRRPVMLAGFVLFTVVSAASAMATTFPVLVALRLVQGLGVSVGTVVSRAVVRDVHDALGTARALAWIGAGMGLAPMIGPVAGGLLSARWMPLSPFVASALLGLVLTLALALRLPETRRDHPAPDGPAGSLLSDCVLLLRSRQFLGFTLHYASIQGAFFAFLAVGAAVFERYLNLGPEAFGLIWSAMSGLYVLAAAAGPRLTARAGNDRALGACATASALAGLILVLGVLTMGVTTAGLLLPMAVLMVAAGVQTPLCLAGTVNSWPEKAATAAGLSSSLALAACGGFSIASGLLYVDSFLPVAWLMAAAAAASIVTWRMSRPGG